MTGSGIGAPARHEMAERAARLRNAIAHEHGLLPDSTASIREDRDWRG